MKTLINCISSFLLSVLIIVFGTENGIISGLHNLKFVTVESQAEKLNEYGEIVELAIDESAIYYGTFIEIILFAAIFFIIFYFTTKLIDNKK